MKYHQNLFFLLIITINLLILSLIQISLTFGEDLNPFTKKKQLVKLDEKGADYLIFIAKGGIIFYRKFVSPVYGNRCKMKPSCSSYSYQAYMKYGFLKGTLLTFDRLLHEGNEYKVSPVIYNKINKELLTYDPLHNNTFWWNNK